MFFLFYWPFHTRLIACLIRAALLPLSFCLPVPEGASSWRFELDIFPSLLPCGHPYRQELHPWRLELDIFPSRLPCGHPYRKKKGKEKKKRERRFTKKKKRKKKKKKKRKKEREEVTCFEICNPRPQVTLHKKKKKKTTTKGTAGRERDASPLDGQR